MAQQKTNRRHQQKPKRIRISASVQALLIRHFQEEKLSQELITQKARRQMPGLISHKTIYRRIVRMQHSQKPKDRPYQLLYRYLKTQPTRQKTRLLLQTSQGIIPHYYVCCRQSTGANKVLTYPFLYLPKERHRRKQNRRLRRFSLNTPLAPKCLKAGKTGNKPGQRKTFWKM